MEGVTFRRDHRLFYRDSNLHTQYISPDPELHYDNYDMGYLVVPRYRFEEFWKWHEKQGTEPDDLFYKFQTKFGDPDTIHVYPDLDFHG